MRDIQSMPMLMAWPVVYLGLYLVSESVYFSQAVEREDGRNGEQVDLRILLQVRECSDEGSHISNHDLGPRRSGSNIMGRRIIRQPSHHEW